MQKEKGVPDSDHNACQKSDKASGYQIKVYPTSGKAKKTKVQYNEVHNEKHKKTRRKE